MMSMLSEGANDERSKESVVEAIIQAAYERAATFESDCSIASNVIDKSDIENCLAEAYDRVAAEASSPTAIMMSSRATTPPVNDGLSPSAPSPYPPGSDKVHIDWSEHYDRPESLDEIIDVDRFASRHCSSSKRRSKNTTTVGAAADRAYAVAQYYQRKLSSSTGVDTVDPESATADANYNVSNNDPIIYVSNHSLHSMSTLGTMGLFATQYSNERSVKKVKSSTTNQEGDHTQQSIDHGAINEERSAKPPTPPPPSPPLKSNNERSAKKVKSFTTNQEEDHTEQQSISLDHAINERGELPSAFAPPPPPTPPLKRRTSAAETSAPEWQQRSSLANSRQDRKVFEQNLLALNQVSKNSRPMTKLSPIPQSPYVVEGATTPGVADTPLTYHVSSLPHQQQHNKQPHNSRLIPTHLQAQPHLGSFTSSAAARQTMKDNVQSLTSLSALQKMNDIDIHSTAKSFEKTRSHTEHQQVPQLPIKAPQHTTTSASRQAVSSENKHSSSETNLRKVAIRRDDTVNGNLGKSWPVGGRSQEQHQLLMKDNDEINLSRVAVGQDPFGENFSKSWPAGGRSPTGGGRGGRSQLQQQQYQMKKDDDLLKKIKVGYQNDREKECLPPPPPLSQPRHHTSSPHSVTCTTSSPVVSPTNSKELASPHRVMKQQSKKVTHPIFDNLQDRMPLPPFSYGTRPMQQQATRTTKKTCPTSKGSTSDTMQVTQRDFNNKLMKLQHQVELSKRTNGLAIRQYHARHVWFYSVPISTCFIMSMILVIMCAINGLDTDERIGLAMGSVFCSILATVFYFLEGKFGMNHHAVLHTSARNEMTTAGFRLDQLSKYKGCGLVSGLHSTKACTSAIRSLHRLDMYIQAINQCIPPIPQGIDNVYKLLNNRINKICRTSPHAIEKRLSYGMDDDNCGGADQHATTTVPFDLVSDAYNCLEEELGKFILYPVFLPNAEDVVARTIDIFFEDTTEDSDSISCRNTESISLM